MIPPNQEKIVFHTIRSTDRYTFPTKEALPFKRVIGLKTAPYTKPAWDVGRISYDKSSIEAEEFIVTHHFALRLMGFFTKYFVEDPRDEWGWPEYPPYNCHRFGYWMTERPDPNLDELPPKPLDVISSGRVIKDPLLLGKLGVIGYQIQSSNENTHVAMHSVVGLGEDIDECIQVMCAHGCLGIDSYQNIRQHYQEKNSAAAIYSIT